MRNSVKDAQVSRKNWHTANQQRVGYSDRINDPFFSRYLENSARYAWIFSLILASFASFGFFLYGEFSDEMDNPEALYIGLTIGAMFLLIALVTTLSKKGGKSWDGTVCDKRVEKKKRRRKNTDMDYHMREYTLYTIDIQSEHRRKYHITSEDDDTLYRYYQIGDKVRYHGRLRTYEKYDKSNDTIIFCNACASLNDIQSEICFRCNCPLLKNSS